MTELSPLFIVLFGAQGSGKGTQARLLQDAFGIPQVATGDLFRHHMKNETELGRLAKDIMARGDLVPDDVTNAMVEERLREEDAATGAVLDGFPRTIQQAKRLEEMLSGIGASVKQAVYIDVAEEELMRRLTGRRVCRSCQATFHIVFNPPKTEGLCDRCGGELYQRDDDRDEGAIRRRLHHYFEQTMPVIDWYRSRGLLAEVDGGESIESVSATIRKMLNGHRQMVK